jgi:hypothetical protein
LCDDYRPVLRSIAAAMAEGGLSLRWHWIDIEDEAELLGEVEVEVEVETFPTLLIADRDGVRFAGPLTPQPDTLRRLLRMTVIDAEAGARWPAVALEVRRFAHGLVHRPADATF